MRSVTIKAVVFDAYGTLYDIQSIAAITDEAFPGYGEIITQIWRLKQLEYTWLRSLMQRYKDFSIITRESLAYTLRCLGLKNDPEVFERIMRKYVDLDLYPDAIATLVAIKDRKLAILSNGSTDMLNSLVGNTGLDRILDSTISIDSKKISGRRFSSLFADASGAAFSPTTNRFFDAMYARKSAPEEDMSNNVERTTGYCPTIRMSDGRRYRI